MNKQNKPWPKSARPRLGAVSSFGMSGTNAHMVVESYDVPPAGIAAAPSLHLLALSAKTEEALNAKLRDLVAALQEREWDARALHAMSYTLLCARQHFEYRAAVVVHDRDSAIHACNRAAGRTPVQ